ncbi:hypothetical protein GGI20_006291, partial [Coemansia sp. BCRC 34301]
QINADDLPNYVMSLYGNMGSDFQVWEVKNTHGIYDNEFLYYIMLLALVCPKFYRTVLVMNTFPEFNAKLAAALDSGPYSKYASQLGRLVNSVRDAKDIGKIVT